MINLQRPARKEGSQLLLVDSSVLPEVFLRVVEAKRMLAVGQVRSLSEAAKAAGISRSALYKYKDCVFVHNEALDDKVITLSARLEDRPGVLSGLLNSLSEHQGNILTVNQSIPVDGVAAVSVSARMPLPLEAEQLRAGGIQDVQGACEDDDHDNGLQGLQHHEPGQPAEADLSVQPAADGFRSVCDQRERGPLQLPDAGPDVRPDGLRLPGGEGVWLPQRDLQRP